MTSYALQLNSVIDVYFNDVSNEILKTNNTWGITGSNYVTNWYINNSCLNRIDCHWRLCNLYITNTKIGSKGIYYSGKGIISIDNCMFYNNILRPRSDFAALFDGDIFIKNSICKCDIYENDSINLFYLSLPYNVDFKCLKYKEIIPIFANNIYVDNLVVEFNCKGTNYTARFMYIADNPLPNIGKIEGTLFKFPNMFFKNISFIGDKVNIKNAILWRPKNLIYNKKDYKINFNNYPFENINNAIFSLNGESINEYTPQINIENSDVYAYLYSPNENVTIVIKDCNIIRYNNQTRSKHIYFKNCLFSWKLENENDGEVFNIKNSSLIDCVFDTPFINNNYNEDIIKLSIQRIYPFYKFSDSNSYTLINNELILGGNCNINNLRLSKELENYINELYITNNEGLNIKDIANIITGKNIRIINRREYDSFGIFARRYGAGNAAIGDVPNIGLCFFNTSTNRPIYWNGSNYVESDGFNASNSRYGESSRKPVVGLNEEGFEFYDTTNKKKILWNGSEWTNLDGTTL